MRTLLGIVRLFVFVLSAIVTFIIQGITLSLITKGPASLVYPRYYHAFLCWLFGIKIIVEGKIDESPNTIYAGNHISYLDIHVMGALVKGSFIAKKDIEKWPLIGPLGKMGRTMYISRDPKDASRETNAVEQRINEGMPIIVFPEGTSSNGKQILPFKSSFFQIFLNKNINIQPFTISIVSVDEQTPVSDNIRDLYAWYGDMDFEPHLLKFSKLMVCIIKVKFHQSITTNCYNNRKTLSNDIYKSVCEGLDLSPPSQYGHYDYKNTPPR